MYGLTEPEVLCHLSMQIENGLYVDPGTLCST